MADKRKGTDRRTRFSQEAKAAKARFDANEKEINQLKEMQNSGVSLTELQKKRLKLLKDDVEAIEKINQKEEDRLETSKNLAKSIENITKDEQKMAHNKSLQNNIGKKVAIQAKTVLDFTIGSGSTGVAAKNLNRNFIGIEQDENYFNIATDRINKVEPQTKLF